MSSVRSTAKRWPRCTKNRAAESGASAPLVVIAVPIDETAQAVVDLGARRKAEIAARGANVGISRRHVALLHGQVLALGGLAQSRFERSDEVAEVLGPVVAEVVDP